MKTRKQAVRPRKRIIGATPEVTAEIMTPIHPKWHEFCKRFEASTSSPTGCAGKKQSTREILRGMGFTEFGIDMTILFMMKQYVLQL